MLSVDVLKKVAPRCPADRVTQYAEILDKLFYKYNVNSVLRQASFFGQVCVESGDFRFMREIWAPEKVPNQLRYERNFDAPWPHTKTDVRNRLAYRLGNSEKGDGFNFRGFGPMQCTGRGNTLAASRYLYGDDRLVQDPKLLDDPEVGFGAALWYWNDRRLNELADVKDDRGITVKVNGAATDHAPSHFLKRLECRNRAFNALQPPLVA